MIEHGVLTEKILHSFLDAHKTFHVPFIELVSFSSRAFSYIMLTIGASPAADSSACFHHLFLPVHFYNLNLRIPCYGSAQAAIMHLLLIRAF